MSANLIEHLRQVKDFRTTDGRRHPLWLVLLFVIMGTMSGYVGYRAWGDFVKRHRRVLIELFRIQRHGVPSYSTIRRILMGVDLTSWLLVLISGHKTMLICRVRSGVA
jgi:hypothetical protein